MCAWYVQVGEIFSVEMKAKMEKIDNVRISNNP